MADLADWKLETDTPRRLSASQRWKAAGIAAIGHPAVALIGRTLRWRIDGAEHLAGLEAAGRSPVMAFWHGRILPATWFFRGRGIVVITSENFDGEWIARIIRRFGYGTARGSSSRGARRALLQLKRSLAQGRAVGFTLDGPRGPARRAQPGAVWLASVTGHPILPFHLEAERYWTVSSWDRTQIPKPFSRVALAVGAPMRVAADLDGGGLESARIELEGVLRTLEARAFTMLSDERAS